MTLPNILLLTVDSLRARNVGYLGYDRETTPAIDNLASQAACFTEAYAPSVHTRESIPSILTGSYPSRAVSRLYTIQRPTIAQCLQDRGYETGAFLGAPFSPVHLAMMLDLMCLTRITPLQPGE